MVAGENLAVDAADDMKVVRVADSVLQRDPRPAGTETVRTLGARMIDVIGIGIIRAVQVPPAIEFRSCQVAVVGHGNRVLAEFQPVRRHVIVDHETENMIQRLVLADMFGAAADDGADLGFGDYRPPVGIDDDRLAVTGQAGWRLEKEIRHAGIMMRLLHQLAVVESDAENLRRVADRRQPVGPVIHIQDMLRLDAAGGKGQRGGQRRVVADAMHKFEHAGGRRSGTRRRHQHVHRAQSAVAVLHHKARLSCQHDGAELHVDHPSRKSSSVTGGASSMGAFTGMPSKQVASLNHFRGAGNPHSCERRRSERSQRVGS